MAPHIWGEKRMLLVARLREESGLTWGVIGARFGVSSSLACTKYHAFKAKQRAAERRKALGPIARPARVTPVVKPGASEKAAPTKAAAPRSPEPVHRPKYIHEADMDIIARID